ncbi:heat shock protein 9/12 [Naematelia encephala]|uniref:Heat shock protein 9/12 n=1 Tax=Naematelia encephala TaxID=71784 RepID=A0A1Y2AIW3_9TREE|nr:heat shock protein 9/12 [Naematelia encephala]
MSDTGRESLTDKVTSAAKPDSEKSYVEQATDYVKGTLDSVASAVQPQQEKSTTQKIGDAVTGDNTNRDAA